MTRGPPAPDIRAPLERADRLAPVQGAFQTLGALNARRSRAEWVVSGASVRSYYN
jgi:hypothetical protein